jgi:hypothetical protein
MPPKIPDCTSFHPGYDLCLTGHILAPFLLISNPYRLPRLDNRQRKLKLSGKVV